MKKHVLSLLAPALIFGAVSCEKKGGNANTDQPNPPAETPKTTTPQDPGPSVEPKIDSNTRAEMVGFARHLPKDTEFLISIHNGKGAADRVKGSKLWKTFVKMSGLPIGRVDLDGDFEDDAAEIAEELADELAEELAEEAMSGPAMMFGEEFTLAMGKGTGEQLEHLMLANSRLTYFQMSAMVQMFATMIGGGEDEDPLAFAGGFEELFFFELLKDQQSGVGLFDKLNMPPMYLAFKTNDDTREMVNQQVLASLAILEMMDPVAVPVSVERGGSTFKGWQLDGEKLAETLEEDAREEMDEDIGADVAGNLIKAISKKDLYLACGMHGDYVVLFVGSSMDDLVFADNDSNSLASGNALAFCDDYASKDLFAIFYGQHEGLQSLVGGPTGGLADVAAGIRNGLSASDKFGDTRNLDALLRMVEDREKALHAMGKVHGGGTVVYFEEGMKIESYGGFDSGYYDWNTPNQLASLGQDPNVMLFANVTSNAAYDTKLREYVEALFETAYTGAMKVTELPIEEGEMEQFKGYMTLFDTEFRADLLAFWDGFSNGFDGSLGQERALIVDLEGGMPAFPTLPQKVVDSAKFPRITWLAPVKDRSRLAGSWEKMNSSMTNITGTISKMMETEIPMQKPMSSDKDDSKTWFFPLPFFNDDFLPSVTVNDNWFAASTSKLQAVDLINKANAGGDTSQGFVMKANFKKLHAYAREMTGLMRKHGGEDLEINEGDLERVDMVIDAFSDIDSMNIHVRREDGLLRGSFHFKVGE